jgi:hypothetical protein
LFDKEKDMTFDPTTNRIPFWLLTEDEKTALIHWPHGWEFYDWRKNEWGDWRKSEWGATEEPSCWPVNSVYRGKPAPKVKSHWFNIYDGWMLVNIWSSLEAAKRDNHGNSVLMRMDICNGEVTVTKET